ncbi:MAG: beta-propeller domain-containing protein [Ignisphaera sp.]|nr:beta-propeller domain-containing protein [Ignisphaera sp.]MCX8168559.1 beta-propeller domain-containing protein [Ignisphaera sp.]MDW8085145.1 beta-propeller domain-containing protein [Ignisphaera sp.]
MGSRIYVLSILMLLVGITLPVIIGYLQISREFVRRTSANTTTQTTTPTTVRLPEYTTITNHITIVTPSSTTIEGSIEARHVLLEEGYKSVIEFIENSRRVLSEVQQIMGYSYTEGGIFDTRVSISTSIPVPRALTLNRVAAQEASYYPTTSVSRTNVQVEGVDEADIVKNSDRIIVVALQNKVYILDVENRRVSSVINITTTQSAATIRGLYLYGEDTLVVIISHPQFINAVFQLRTESSLAKTSVQRSLEATSIYIFDLSDIYSPILLRNTTLSASYLDSRLSNRYLYIIAVESIYGDDGGYVIPLLDGKPIEPASIIAIDELPAVYTIMLAIDLETLEHSATAYMTSYGFRIYMSRNNNLYIGSPISSHQRLYLDAVIQFVEISLKYLPTDVSVNVSRYVGKGNYLDAYNHILNYLSSLDQKEAVNIIERINSELSRLNYSYIDATKFYVYSVDGIQVKHRGVFKVNGSLLDQFCMEEYGDRYFIVATTSTEQSIKYEVVEYRITPPMYREVEVTICSNSKCSITTIPIQREDRELRRIAVQPVFTAISTSNNVYIADARNLEIIGSLKGLAEGERIYAGRLVKNIFFLVTFRQVDPLFAIDVAEPTHPVVLGYLKIPGFSEYLHPLPGDLLLGVGLEDGALKISIFNVSNPSNMAEVSLMKISHTWSPALQDHHAVTVYLARNISIIPAYIGFGAKQGFIILSYADAKLNLKDIVDHTDPLRSVYIGSKLFTISSTAIRIYDLDRERIEWEVRIG